ncbi:RING finger protein 145-like [Nyctibius grandis]|uniref:RING finger protein 145-like n=1 Tax=Nyctibius grandis TaxID=48427 RepID=UPI0035BC2F18
MSRLEAVANVALRVPALALLELLYRWDEAAVGELLRPRRGDPPVLRGPALRGACGLGRGPGGPMCPPHTQVSPSPRRPACLCVPCAVLARGRWPWLFGAPVVPVLARLGLPPHALPAAANAAAAATALHVLGGLGARGLGPLRVATAACRGVTRALELRGPVALGTSLWARRAVPLLFLVPLLSLVPLLFLAFWLALFILRLGSFLTSTGPQQGLLFLLLSSAAGCCSTPYSLLGLAFAVSYLARGILTLGKLYLLGCGALRDGNGMGRGVTEGVTLLALALQTGLPELPPPQRTFLLGILLFIAGTSTLQSLGEVAEPVVLALGASRSRSPWRHFRAITMCLFLLVSPCAMAWGIARWCHPDGWLLVLLASGLLTALRALGTLFTYTLFLVEPLRDAPLEGTDEVTCWARALGRALELLVAVGTLGYGARETLLGEWSWVGTAAILAHSYLNVWLRARASWRSLLLRRGATKKVTSLPRATGGQLQDHHDVCAICFQDMQVAVVTRCGHLFHAACLRQWLCVQDTCPMCHLPVTPVATKEDPGTGDKAPEDGAAASPATSPPSPTDCHPRCQGPRVAPVSPCPHGLLLQ